MPLKVPEEKRQRYLKEGIVVPLSQDDGLQ
jgi:hypothetical protein